MNFRAVLILVIVVFYLFCGGAAGGGELPESIQAGGAADLAAMLRAEGGEAGLITIGSVDPNSGFKFRLELTTKGAAIRTAEFSEYSDRDYRNPHPLAVLSPVRLSDGSEIVSVANTGFVFVSRKMKLAMDRLDWRSLGVTSQRQAGQPACQRAAFEAVIKDQLTDEPVIRLVKSYKVTAGSYMLDCNVTVENLSAAEQKVQFCMTGPTGISREEIGSDERKATGGFRNNAGEVTGIRLDVKKLNGAKADADRRLIKGADNFLYTL